MWFNKFFDLHLSTQSFWTCSNSCRFRLFHLLSHSLKSEEWWCQRKITTAVRNCQPFICHHPAGIYCIIPDSAVSCKAGTHSMIRFWLLVGRFMLLSIWLAHLWIRSRDFHADMLVPSPFLHSLILSCSYCSPYLLWRLFRESCPVPVFKPASTLLVLSKEFGLFTVWRWVWSSVSFIWTLKSTSLLVKCVN